MSKNISDVATTDLKLAASAWRRNAFETLGHRARSGILKYLIQEPDMSVYDKIDDLIAEIERLRWAEYRRTMERQ